MRALQNLQVLPMRANRPQEQLRAFNTAENIGIAMQSQNRQLDIMLQLRGIRAAEQPLQQKSPRVLIKVQPTECLRNLMGPLANGSALITIHF
jgi:hypothetical protein